MKLNSIVMGAVILGAVALTVHSQNTAPKTAMAAKVAVVAMRDAMLLTQDGKQATAAMQAKFEPTRAALGEAAGRVAEPVGPTAQRRRHDERGSAAETGK